jgi:hypothetical protein
MKRKRLSYAWYLPELNEIHVYNIKITRYAAYMVAAGDEFFRRNFVFLGVI